MEMDENDSFTESHNDTAFPHDYNGSYDYLYYYADYEYDDHVFQIFDFEVPIYGYIWPMLVILTSLCNILVITGFLRRRMRTPTNVLLVSIAISDSLTGLVTLPATFYVYSHENMYLSKTWCNINMISRLYVARAFHTVSVWQTLLLGIHRYLQLKSPSWSEKVCDTRRTLMSIVIIYMMAFLLHIYHAFDIKVIHGFCQWEVEVPCGWTCVYIWCTLLFVHVIPSFMLIAIAILMIISVRDINVIMTNGSKRVTSKSRNITLVVIFIVVIFLIPELPYAVFYMIVLSLKHSNKALLPLRTNRIFHCVYEVLLVVSFHLNFWVYCVLVKKFRSCVKAMLRLIMCDPIPFSRLEDETTSGNKGVEMNNVDTAVEFA